MKFINRNKWTITRTFLAAFLIVITLTFVINCVLIFSSVIETSKISLDNPEAFTIEFSKYISYKNNIPYVEEEGKEELIKKAAWIQILDEDFKEKYSFHKPKVAPKRYNPITLMHGYKYDIGYYSIFIGESKNNHKTYSYIVGFPLENIAKHTLVFSPFMVKKIISGGILFLLCINILIAIIVAYLFFATKMGKPLERIIQGIKELSEGNYEKYYKEEGIYREVFVSLNKLNKILNENKLQRKELDKMRDNWITSISHDVKTPLSSIKGYSEIMKKPDYSFSPSEVKEYSSIIWKKASYIQALIEELNLTYKLKNKLFLVNKSKTNMVNMLQNIIIEILNHPMYSKRNLNFHYQKEIVMGFVDEVLLKRALTNLIFNAIIHNDEKVKVDILIYEKDNSIYILIKDTGKGISKEDLPYIFERYYRGTNTSSSNEGSGLGMAIAKQIIDIHRGEIYIESKLDVGTDITIILNK
ncbi:HAMP domain-containing sensor histidine kinase [Clostridium sporogenes]|uniref:HAMP domain-containing sensor histidine kinase n=1 Tax=Clostridium sporogenes TaxID=1509 RepID=UPI001F3679F2|nr:HAMP domain-containing sensor histidine kinase [Clostridium sporogenes]UJA33958.1 HAMP domain-containing histidine kinase [Clostridium sporogenes]